MEVEPLVNGAFRIKKSALNEECIVGAFGRLNAEGSSNRRIVPRLLPFRKNDSVVVVFPEVMTVIVVIAVMMPTAPM